MNPTTTPPAALEVLDFWFGDGLQRDWPTQDHNELWFGGGPAQDAAIRQRFAVLGRTTTPEEDAFLKDGLRFGQ